jgi:hypothetical protein
MQYEDEYMKRVRERFYKQVRETNWGSEEDRVSKPRGRKPKERVTVQRPLNQKQKFFNFN